MLDVIGRERDPLRDGRGELVAHTWWMGGCARHGRAGAVRRPDGCGDAIGGLIEDVGMLVLDITPASNCDESLIGEMGMVDDVLMMACRRSCRSPPIGSGPAQQAIGVLMRGSGGRARRGPAVGQRRGCRSIFSDAGGSRRDLRQLRAAVLPPPCTPSDAELATNLWRAS